MQPPMEVGVAEQEGQPPAPGHAVGLKIQLKLLLGVLGTEGGRQRAQLQRFPHRLAGGGGGVLVHDLLHCTRNSCRCQQGRSPMRCAGRGTGPAGRRSRGSSRTDTHGRRPNAEAAGSAASGPRPPRDLHGFVHIHILVGVAEQLPQGAALEVAGDGAACRIAQGHLGVLAGILCRLRPDAAQHILCAVPVHAVEDSDELVAAVAAHEVPGRHGQTQLFGKGADVLVAPCRGRGYC